MKNDILKKWNIRSQRDFDRFALGFLEYHLNEIRNGNSIFDYKSISDISREVYDDLCKAWYGKIFDRRKLNCHVEDL